MKNLITILIFLILSYGLVRAGTLYGRIIDENGRSLAKRSIIIEGKEIMTNEFGGYAVDLPDGERNINITIEDIRYSIFITIYSPETKQNWRIDRKNKRLIKIR